LAIVFPPRRSLAGVGGAWAPVGLLPLFAALRHTAWGEYNALRQFCQDNFAALRQNYG
jgi:hypothetical protein